MLCVCSGDAACVSLLVCEAVGEVVDGAGEATLRGDAVGVPAAAGSSSSSHDAVVRTTPVPACAAALRRSRCWGRCAKQCRERGTAADMALVLTDFTQLCSIEPAPVSLSHTQYLRAHNMNLRRLGASFLGR